MSVKSTLKRILPIGVFERIKRIANGGLSLYGMTLAQAHRFNKAYAKYDSTGICQIAARMTFFTHQIEKGLSHTNFRYGFGHKPLQYLKDAMESISVQMRIMNPLLYIRVHLPHYMSMLFAMKGTRKSSLLQISFPEIYGVLLLKLQ